MFCPGSPGFRNVHAIGLALLSNLTTLELSNNFDPDGGHVLMHDLTLHKLQNLHYSWQPFAEPVSQDFCPALQCLRLTGGESLLPDWIAGRPMHTLGCARWGQTFRSIEPHDILCQVCELIVPCEHPDSEVDPIPIWCLQQLPNLRYMRAVKAPSSYSDGLEETSLDWYPPAVIAGDVREICWLQRNLTCKIEEGLDVQLRYTVGPRKCIVSIQDNGHPMLCPCADCCT